MDAESSVVKHRNVSELKDAGPRVGARGDEVCRLLAKLNYRRLRALHHNVLQITVKAPVLRLRQRARAGHDDERMAREARVVGRVDVREGVFREASALVEIFAAARDFVNRRVYL